ncbi:MAG TPA: carboxymuconolactone decarboxylase family protein [bacterium]
MAKIDPITIEKTTPEIKKVLDKLHEYYGNVPLTYRVIVRRPQIASSLLQLKKTVMDSGRLDRKLKEMICFVVSSVNKCGSCADSHIENLKKIGTSEVEINSLMDLDFTRLDEETAAALEFAHKSASETPEISAEMFKKLKEMYNDTEIVELLSAIGLSKLFNTLNTLLELPSY